MLGVEITALLDDRGRARIAIAHGLRRSREDASVEFVRPWPSCGDLKQKFQFDESKGFNWPKYIVAISRVTVPLLNIRFLHPRRTLLSGGVTPRNLSDKYLL